MKNPWQTFLAMLLATVLAAAYAGWAGVQYGLNRTVQDANLYIVIDRDLQLTTEQHRRMQALEANFAMTRRDLEEEMRATNKELAEIIAQHHRYDDQARKTVERLAATFGMLQEKTIEHLLAIRTLLTPSQARRFDEEMSNVLAGRPS